MNRNRYGTNLAFIDMLFNLVIAVTVLFLLSLLMINPVKKNSGREEQAPYILIVRWQANSNHDVDVWGKAEGEICSFQNRQTNSLSLDRDDLGPDNTTSMEHFIPINEEIMSIRTLTPNMYIFNVHWYRKRDEGPAPIVQWALINTKDNFKVVISGTVFLNEQGQEKTLLRFRVDEKGRAVSIDTAGYYPYINRAY